MKNMFKNEDGYFLLVVTIIGIILAIIFGAILPQLHTGQQVRATTNLNELRAYEAAKKGLIAVMMGVEDADNFQELIGYGYSITGVTTGTPGNGKFTISGDEGYAALFPIGEKFEIYGATLNNGTYTVNNVSYVGGANKDTEITVDEAVTDATVDGAIRRNKGLLWSINQLCGATAGSTNYDEYRDEDGNVQFISGCQGIDVSIPELSNEKGVLQIVILVSWNGNQPSAIDGDTDPRKDGLYFYNDGVLGPNGSPFLSEGNDTGITWGNFDYTAGTGVRYFDYEGNGFGSYATKADFKYDYNNIQANTWFFSVGNNGTWRGNYNIPPLTELWNIQKDFSSDGDAAFQGKDNNGDGSINNSDKVQVFIIVRSRGITAAPGTGYGADKTDLRLVNEANSHLPNPMPQVLEAGFSVPAEQ